MDMKKLLVCLLTLLLAFSAAAFAEEELEDVMRGGIFTGAPVRGLRPIRAGFCCTLNVPSPVRVRRSPCRRLCKPSHFGHGIFTARSKKPAL